MDTEGRISNMKCTEQQISSISGQIKKNKKIQVLQNTNHEYFLLWLSLLINLEIVKFCLNQYVYYLHLVSSTEKI